MISRMQTEAYPYPYPFQESLSFRDYSKSKFNNNIIVALEIPKQFSPKLRRIILLSRLFLKSFLTIITLENTHSKFKLTTVNNDVHGSVN